MNGFFELADPMIRENSEGPLFTEDEINEALQLNNLELGDLLTTPAPMSMLG